MIKHFHNRLRISMLRILIIWIILLPFTTVSGWVPMISVPDSTGPKVIAFNGKDLNIDRQAFLSQHDIVSLSPAVDGYNGFPIGNGDLGAMAWTPPDKLIFQINKTNTWDDAPDGVFGPWEDAGTPDKSELFTSLRSCGQLKIEPGLPLFDWMYLSDFEGRLSLSDAQASWHAKGPLGEVSCRSFIAADPSVMVVHYEDNLSEAVERRVILARWGSRVFEHWYRSIRPEFHLGSGDTKAGFEGDETWIEQSTRSLNFAMAAKLVGPGIEAQRLNSHEAGYIMNTGKECTFNLFLSVVTSEESLTVPIALN
jgi:alpha-L-fucosidase 2